MGKRIKNPVDANAFRQAQDDFYKKYKAKFVDDTGRQIVPLADSRYKKYRKEWLKLYEKHGGKTDDGKAFQGKDPAAAHEPCGYDNKIATVQILDGDKKTFLAANGKQHVNLPVEDKWVDGTQVSSKDRLGRKLRVKIEFTKKRKEEFGVALLSHRHNAEYTDQEKAARASFNYQRADADQAQGNFVKRHGDEYTARTDKKGVHITDYVFEVTPAVGDRYLFVAWDANDNRVYSVEIKTVRTVYYMTIMTGAAQAYVVPAANYRQTQEQTYRTHHTELVFLGSENLPDHDHYDMNVDVDFIKDVNALCADQSGALGKAYAEYVPHLLRYVFVDHCANSRTGALREVAGVPIGPGAAPVRVPVISKTVTVLDPTFDSRKPLWFGFGDPVFPGARPVGNEWFVSGTITLDTGQTFPLSHTDCTPVEEDHAHQPGLCKEVDVDVQKGGHAARGTVALTVVYASKLVIGSALIDRGTPGTMVMCARKEFEPIAHDRQVSAALHEVGHQLGMVADITYKLSSKDEVPATGVEGHAYRYEHNGAHCSTGVAARFNAGEHAKYHNQSLHLTQAQCLMFGIVTTPPNMDFCPACVAILRKTDISEGFV